MFFDQPGRENGTGGGLLSPYWGWENARVDLSGKYKTLGESRLVLSAALTTAVIAVSFAAIFIRLAEAPALVIAFYRLFFTLIILVPHLLMQWKDLRMLKKTDIAGMAASGLFLAGHFYLWISSLEHAPVAVSVVLVSVHPLIVAFAGHILLGDAIPGRFFTSMLLVLLGTAAIAAEGVSGFTEGSTELQGSLMALGGAVMMAGYLLAGRRLRQNLSTTIYVSGTYGVAALLLFTAALMAEIPLTGYPAREYALFIALAVIPTLLGHTVFNWALKKVRAALVSLLYLGEPLGATILALIILREMPTSLQALGGLTILIGLYIVLRSGDQPA